MISIRSEGFNPSLIIEHKKTNLKKKDEMIIWLIAALVIIWILPIIRFYISYGTVLSIIGSYLAVLIYRIIKMEMIENG